MLNMSLVRHSVTVTKAISPVLPLSLVVGFSVHVCRHACTKPTIFRHINDDKSVKHSNHQIRQHHSKNVLYADSELIVIILNCPSNHAEMKSCNSIILQVTFNEHQLLTINSTRYKSYDLEQPWPDLEIGD